VAGNLGPERLRGAVGFSRSVPSLDLLELGMACEALEVAARENDRELLSAWISFADF